MDACIIPETNTTERGYLRVNDHLQVEGFTDVFALGDCSESGSPKMAYVAGQQGELVAANILSIAGGKRLKKWKKRK